MSDTYPLSYQIMASTSLEELVEQVCEELGNNTLNQFWEPLGKPDVCDGKFFQALVWYATDEAAIL